MKLPEDEELDRRFAQAWKDWAKEPPHQSPAAAAARVALRIRQSSARHRPSWLLTAAAAALLALAGTTVLWKPVRTIVPPQPEAQLQNPSLGKGEVLMWIDEETPLYMTFQEPVEEQKR